MKRTIIMATLFLASGLVQAATESGAFVLKPLGQLEQAEMSPADTDAQTDSIDRNMAPIDSGVERREAAVTSEGEPTVATAEEARNERINQNTNVRTDRRVKRRERAAAAVGAPGLDAGIERRAERRENRRIERRTGQPATDGAAQQ